LNQAVQLPFATCHSLLVILERARRKVLDDLLKADKRASDQTKATFLVRRPLHRPWVAPDLIDGEPVLP
jgi:hypothetical protein